MLSKTNDFLPVQYLSFITIFSMEQWYRACYGNEFDKPTEEIVLPRSKHIVVCSDHFEQKCFRNPAMLSQGFVNMTHILLWNSIFLFNSLFPGSVPTLKTMNDDIPWVLFFNFFESSKNTVKNCCKLQKPWQKIIFTNTEPQYCTVNFIIITKLYKQFSACALYLSQLLAWTSGIRRGMEKNSINPGAKILRYI